MNLFSTCSNNPGHIHRQQAQKGPIMNAQAMEAEAARVASLRSAEKKAEELFAETVARGWVAPGWGERQLSNAIRDLAVEMFGTKRFWHKRVVRAGRNTLQPYEPNPPDRILTDDEIVFFDFGPIFEDFEADFGRTYVIGNDPNKHRLAADLPKLWDAGKAYFDATPDITGAQLYDHVLDMLDERGWGHGASHAGHLVGRYPHAEISGDDIDCYVTRNNDTPMRRLGAGGQPLHWILEIHAVDRERGYGGFVEQLLDI